MIDDDHMEALLEFTSPVMVLLFLLVVLTCPCLHILKYEKPKTNIFSTLTCVSI